MKHKFYLLLFAGLIALSIRAGAAVETFAPGSYIINMGVTPQTVNNGLKPYGLLYDLLKTYQIPIKWVIGQAKAKDGADFNYNGTAYRGGTFIIPAEYMNTATMSRIVAFGVTGTVTTSVLSVDVTHTLNAAPKWTLDLQNGKIAQKFLIAAGIPTSAYTFKYPSQLSQCDDIFVLPHADPTWAKHGNLYNFVRTNKGAVWAGCRSGSSLENLCNPSNTSQQLNFLANNVGTPGHALVPNGSHKGGTPPYIHQHPTSPAAQYMGVTDQEHTSGAEQIYMPVSGGSWRSTTQIIAYDPTQQNVPGLSPGPAAVVVYGRAYGNSSYGWVMYEAGHDVGGTTPSAIAAQRAFFNFSYRAMVDKTPVISGVSGAAIVSNGSGSYSVTATSPVGAALTYQWSSTCGGTFSNPTAATTTFTPPTVTSSTNCVLRVVVSDPCRSSFATKPITINPSGGRPPVAVNDSKAVSCGVDSITLNVLTNDSDPDGDSLTFVSFTPANGVTPGGNFYYRGNGNVTFIPTDSFTGTQNITYTIKDGTSAANSSAVISITVGTPTAIPKAVGDTIITTRNVIRKRINVKANDTDASGISNSIVRVVVPATKGLTSVNTDGTIDYIPNLDAVGLDSFSYQISNAGGFTSTAKVKVTINAGSCGTGQVGSGITTVINSSRTNLGDTYINEDQASRNYGACTTILVNGENNKVMRGLLKFDVSGIPAGATIDSAKLVMYAGAVQNNTYNSIDLYRVVTSWAEGTQCDNNGTPNWGGLSTCFAPGFTSTTSVGPIGFYSWNATSLVQSWVNGTYTNHGLGLKFATEGGSNNLKTFASKEYATASCRPVLLVSYHINSCASVPVRAPIANPDFATTNTLTPVTIPTATNDIDVAGPKTYSIVTPPTSGSATINTSTGVVTYTPSGTFVGIATLAYRVLNTSTTLADTANVYVTIVNGPIDAINDTPPGDSSGVVQTINVKANDIDPESPGPLGNTYGVTIYSAPKNGTATVNSNGQVVYTPVAQFSGRDTLIYQLCEPSPASGCGTTYCDTARVFITVYNRKPTPKNDTVSKPPCSAITISLLANDTDPENHSLTVNNPLLVVPASAGSVVNNNDGTITFTPAIGTSGTTLIKYTVTDDGEPTNRTSDTALVVINTIIAANAKPIAVDDYADTVSMDLANEVDVLENDSDPDGNQLSDPQIIKAPLHGVATVMMNGMISYMPNGGYVGRDSLVYRIYDIVNNPATCTPVAGLYDTAVVYFYYSTPNTVYAVNDENSTLINKAVSGNVIFNDYDLEGDSIQFVGFLASNGTAVNTGSITVSGVDSAGAPVANVGILAINPNGGYAYTPAINFVGVMSVKYAIQDNRIDQAYDTATLRITVTPLAKRTNSIIANNDENFTYGFPVSGNVKDNDRDPQGDAFNVTTYTYDTNGDGTQDATATLGSTIIVGGVSTSGRPVANAGIFTLNTNGTYTYSPSVDFHGDINIVYTICDVATPSACQSANLHIIVFPNINGPLNDPPFAGDDFATTTINVPVDGSFISNDSDPNGDPLSYNGITIVPSGPRTPIGSTVLTQQGGTVQYYKDGTYRYTPPTGFTGPDYAYYTVCDVTVVNPQPLCADALIHFLVDSNKDLCVKARVYLEGSLIDNGNALAADGRPLMRDNLRNSPFTGMNYIPVDNIYEFPTQYVDVTARYTKFAPQNSSYPQFQRVTDSATVFGVTGQNAIVDWVFVELRSKTNNTVIAATRAGLIQRDGDIVETNGIGCLQFPNVPLDSYFVSVRHRSHLGTMTKFAQSSANLNTLVDLTVPTTPLYDQGVQGPNNFAGLSQKENVVGTYRAMWQGDFNQDGKIKYDNPNDDLSIMLSEVVNYPGNTDNATNFDFAYGYRQGDYNMDSKVKYDNPNDDNARLLSQLVNYPLNTDLATNFDFFLQQLP